jgi:hypothetical protein
MTPRFTSATRRQSPSLGPLLDEFEKAMDDYEVQASGLLSSGSAARRPHDPSRRSTFESEHPCARARVLSWSVVLAINAELTARL